MIYCYCHRYFGFFPSPYIRIFIPFTVLEVGLNGNLTVRSHEQKLHELNTLDWDELVASNANTPTIKNGGNCFCFIRANGLFTKNLTILYFKFNFWQETNRVTIN